VHFKVDFTPCPSWRTQVATVRRRSTAFLRSPQLNQLNLEGIDAERVRGGRCALVK